MARSFLESGRRGATLRVAPLAAIFSLIVTGTVLPAPDTSPTVEGETVRLREADEGWARNLTLPISANVVAFDWSGATFGEIEMRVKKDGRWGPVIHIAGDPDEGPDPGSREDNGRTSSFPVWVGAGVEEIKITVEEGNLRDLRMQAIRSPTSNRRWGPSGADAQIPPQPGIILRAEWGADESWRTCDPTITSDLRYSILHHTATTNNYSPDEAAAYIRAIYYHHTQNNGWCDIGYNFLVDRFGRAYEGRFGGIDEAVVGAHAGGFNTGSAGVALLGSFHTDPLPSASRDAVVKLLSWKLALHEVAPNTSIQVISSGSSKYQIGTEVTLNTISSHRDVSATTCPGDNFYAAVPRIRTDVERMVEEAKLTSGPSVSSWGTARLDIFAAGADGALWHKWWDGSRWGGPESLGGVLTTEPAAISWGPNRIDVFVRGSDDALWHKSYDGAHGWSGWDSLGGVLTAAPTAASWGAGRLDVVVVGTDGGLWQKFYDGLRWSGWNSLGGVANSAPTAVSWGPGRVDVFVRGTDQALWQKFWNGSTWSGWNTLGGVLTSGPASSSWGSGRLDVFARGTDGALWHRFHAGFWHGWDSRGSPPGGMTSGPSAVSWGSDRIDVFSRAEGLLWQRFWDGTRWAG